MTRLAVTLGERESDVLLCLVNTPNTSFTQDEIVREMTDQGAPRDDAKVGVPRALRLLHQLGFVRTVGNERNLAWIATDAAMATYAPKPWVPDA